MDLKYCEIMAVTWPSTDSEEKWSLTSDKKNECWSMKAVHLLNSQNSLTGEERRGSGRVKL